MAASHDQRIKVILDNYGTTFCKELKIDIQKATPSPLFRLLCFSILASARISYGAALKAARALTDEGWTTPKKMAGSTWRQRTKVLNKSGYARYDESTSRYLGDTCDLLNEHYKGDLNNLREEAGKDPSAERKRLKEFKGLGDVGVDIFFREAQAAWDELFPFIDDRAKKAAKALNLPSTAQRLAELAGKKNYPNLVAGLIRVDLGKACDEVKSA